MNEFFCSLISAELDLVGVSVTSDRICDHPAIGAGRTAGEVETPAPRIVFQDSDLRSALG